jgi:branched-chain amino acid transport system ATP-binding protein
VTDPILTIDQMTAGYGEAPAVRDLTMEAFAGEVIGIIGANGAGKTTTLRAISGTTARVISGRILFCGDDLAPLSATARARRGIAHVPEGRGLFFGLTVAEHLRLRYRGETLHSDAAYEFFPELRELRGRRAGLLSGGEQQMLAIGRALVRHPALLLLDELSLGLAPVVVERILPVVRDYAKSSGCAVLLVEQHVHLALEVVDRAYVLAHGDVVLNAPADVLRSDSHLLASSYLGVQAVDHN